LGEIETALLGHEWVREAAVVAQAVAGGQRLVAYVVLQEGRPGGEARAELQQYLAGLLPEYMLPAAIELLAALPRTPNGKLARRELPAVREWGEPGGTAAVTRALTPVEQLVAGIWSEVLGRPVVEAGANFFALGGHSLLATQVVSRLRTAFGLELPLRLLFESPTLAAQARTLQHFLGADKPLPMPPIQRARRTGQLPLSFAQQRLWFMDQLQPGQSIYNIPSAVRLTGELNVAALRQSLNDLVNRHEILRATFSDVEGT